MADFNINTDVAAVANAKGVENTHPDYDKRVPQWRRCRDAIAGQDAIYAGMTLYLPLLKGEKMSDYKKRRERTTWYNASYRTIAGLHGMLFRKDPAVTNPTGIGEYLKDVTMSGIPFTNFCKEIGEEVLSVGWVGVLVDHPPAPDTGNAPLTVAVAEKLGLRPKMAIYEAEGITNWRHKLINNSWKLSQVRLKECVSEETGDFTENKIDQYRVLDLTTADQGLTHYYRQRVFRQNERKEWVQFGPDVVPLMNNKPLDFIPFIFVTAEGIVADCDEPPLIDLFDLNVKHYMVTADYEHACHFTGLPTPWVTGLAAKIDPMTGRETPISLNIGSQSAWVFTDPQTKVGFLEFTGTGVGALEKNLAAKEAQMAAIGARMLAPEKAGVEAADTLSMRHNGEQSILASISESVSMAMTKALTWFAQWAGADGETDVNVNRDFMPKVMDAPTLTALMGAWQAGGLSEQEFFDQLQRGDVIASDKTFEKHQAEIEQSPPLGMQMAQAGVDALNNPPDTAGGTGGSANNNNAA